MGCRHQFFIVAKIRGRYRALAVTHCHNKCDTDAIQACWRLLKILDADANQKLIQHDLEHAARQPDAWWDALDHASVVQFPFIQTCLTLGAAYDCGLQQPYFYPVNAYSPAIVPMNLLYNNQSGSTTIDITDPGRLRYCFMYYPSWRHGSRIDSDESDGDLGKEARADLLRCRPLGVQEYLSWPYSASACPDVDLGPWDLISAAVLHELWPGTPWPGQGKAAVATTESPGNLGPRSLMDLALPRLLDGKLEESVVRLLERIPGFADRLQRFLRASPDCFRRPGGVALLQLAMKQCDKPLDFSPFPWLPEDIILQLVRETDADIRKAARTIDLSGNRNISAGTVAKLLELCPRTTTLVLLHTENLPLGDVSDVLAGRNDVELYHADLFSAAFPTVGTGHRPALQGPLVSIPNHAAPSGTLDEIFYFSISRDIPGDHPSRLGTGGLRWSELAPKDQATARGLRRSRFFCTSIPLRDAFLNPARMGTWFPQLMWYFATNSATLDRRSYRGGHAMMAASCALAMNSGDNWGVRHIPSTALNCHRRFRFPTFGPIEAGRWSLLVVTEDDPQSRWYTRQCNALRYVFLTRDPKTDRVLACRPFEFYEHTAKTQEAAPDLWIPELAKQMESEEIMDILGPFMRKWEALAEGTRLDLSLTRSQYFTG